jgi:hypothetical protein
MSSGSINCTPVMAACQNWWQHLQMGELLLLLLLLVPVLLLLLTSRAFPSSR